MVKTKPCPVCGKPVSPDIGVHPQCREPTFHLFDDERFEKEEEENRFEEEARR